MCVRTKALGIYDRVGLPMIKWIRYKTIKN
jgi:hypothetical protein